MRWVMPMWAGAMAEGWPEVIWIMKRQIMWKVTLSMILWPICEGGVEEF